MPTVATSSQNANTNRGPVPTVSIKPPPGTVYLGVLNEKAKSLPEPVYPPAARAVRASGEVLVQVMIDEKGRVIKASAITGHPLLRAGAEQAARNAEFSPVALGGEPVKISGVISYNFAP